jgi:hypothetical protein
MDRERLMRKAITRKQPYALQGVPRVSCAMAPDRPSVPARLILVRCVSAVFLAMAI